MVRIPSIRTCIFAGIAAVVAACGPNDAPRQGDQPQAREITRENFREFGDYVVHFNAQATTMLPPEVARAYGIQRSSNRAMLSVAVIRKEPESTGQPVTATVNVQASNLTGQLKDIRVREIREGDAIYYIGEVPVSNEETLIFDIGVQPEAADAPFQLRFRQQFYTN
jgi:hypothetical protein